MSRPDMRDPVLERRQARPFDGQICAVLRKGSDNNSYRRGGDLSIAFLHETARATIQHCSNASQTFHGVQLYANHRMRRFLRRRKKKTGLGRYRDYTNEYLYKELGLAYIEGQGPVRYSSR